MRLGLALPQYGTRAGPEALLMVAERAEELSYDSVWVGDRIMWPLNPRDPYPVTPDGSLPTCYQSVLDPIETLTYVAAITKRVRLGISVLVAAYQGPVLAARRLATLDVLSGGRVLCGVGAGWSRDEYEACGVPFNHRFERMAELLRALIAIWTQDTVDFKGRFYTIAASKIGPKPVQKPHPPIYQAATAPKSLRLAAELADGINPGGPPSWDWLAGQIEALKTMAKETGRNPEELQVVLRVFPALSKEPRSPDGWLFTGTLEQIKGDARRAADLGVGHMFFDLQFVPDINLQGLLEQAEILRALG